jgi:hypothetical protein
MHAVIETPAGAHACTLESDTHVKELTVHACSAVSLHVTSTALLLLREWVTTIMMRLIHGLGGCGLRVGGG